MAGFQQARRSYLAPASIVDDGGESAVFHMTEPRDSAVGQAPWLETNIPFAIREACSSPASQRHGPPSG